MVLVSATQDQLRLAVSSAIKAPSVHNTQPWRFRISEGAVDLYADRSRLLTALDPTGRQLETSCGVALLFLRVSLRAAGFTADVTLLPDDDADHLARVVVASTSDASPSDQALCAAIPSRHVQREAFEARPLAPALLSRFRRAAEAEGAWLAVVHRHDDRIELITLLSRADREETRDPAYLEEIQAWLRTEPAADGVPVQAVPAHVERHSDVTMRDFNPGHVDEPTAAPARDAPVDEHPALVVLGTDSDDARDHLIAGMALGRLLLEANVHGVAASILGQVMDLPGPRAAVRTALNLVGEPQTVLRLGYGNDTSGVVAGRRALDDVLIT
jgi:nitroreductase